MAVAVQGNGFRYSGNDTFLLDEVVCTGNESSLIQCTHAPWGVSNCQPGEEAGVLCPEALFPAHDVIYFLDKASHKIIRLNVQLLTYNYLNIDNVYRPQSFDYDPANDAFYFYDDHLKQILYMKSDGTDLRVVLQLDFNSEIYNIKVDASVERIYYSDKGLNVIAYVNVKGGTPTYIITTNLNSPSGIALNTRSQTIYWTDWGLQPKIEISLYDGTSRQVLVNTNIKWPNSLAIDFQENRVYFADGGTEKIESMDLNGSNRKVHKQDNAHILSVDLIGNDIYYTTINGSTPYRVKKDGSNPISIGRQNFNEITEIIGYKLGTDNLGQPLSPTSTKFFLRLMGNTDASRGPIEVYINGQWRTICNLNWDDKAAKVVCNMLGYDRFKAVSADYPLEGSLNMNTLKCTGDEDSIVSCHFTPQDWYLHECSTNYKAGVLCEDSDPNIVPDFRIDNFLIFINSSTGGLVRMDLNTYSYTVSHMTSLDQFVPMAVAYDTYYQHFYVSHVNHVTNTSTITAYNTRGTVVATVNNIPAGSVINGLALDTRRSTLYYTDAGNNVIGSISTLGSESRIIARNVTQPGGIALDKNHLTADVHQQFMPEICKHQFRKTLTNRKIDQVDHPNRQPTNRKTD
ncbi:hypothetical protein Btru_050141 [Bulinus truncatus]|nr:hypothetical protein Btru_050141 [Bulinus truncatus]